MKPEKWRKSGVAMSNAIETMDKTIDEIPTKEEILNEIRDGYVYVMSGGKGQPVDGVHREIAEELAREEHAHNADISR